MPSNVPYKPEDYQSVSPSLHVNGAAKLIAFLKEVFDGIEIALYPRPDGTVGHAALRIGDSVIELADASPEWPAMPCALQI
jgi:PhnB protein